MPTSPWVPVRGRGGAAARPARAAGTKGWGEVGVACGSATACADRNPIGAGGLRRAGRSQGCLLYTSELGYRSPSSEIVHTAQGDRHRTWRFRFNGEGLLVWSTRSSEWAARGSLQPSLSLPVKKGPAGRSSAQQPARSWATPGAMSWGSSGSTASCALGPDRRVSTELPTLSRAIGFRSLAAGDPMR